MNRQWWVEDLRKAMFALRQEANQRADDLLRAVCYHAAAQREIAYLEQERAEQAAALARLEAEKAEKHEQWQALMADQDAAKAAWQRAMSTRDDDARIENHARFAECQRQIDPLAARLDELVKVRIPEQQRRVDALQQALDALGAVTLPEPPSALIEWLRGEPEPEKRGKRRR